MKSIDQWKFKQKKCKICGVDFTPKSGSSIRCDVCWHTCQHCGAVMTLRSRAKYCSDECRYVKLRSFHKTRKPPQLFCEDCRVPITPRHKRCVKCSAKARVSDPSFAPKWSRWRYDFNGTTYRSQWEVTFARLLQERNISYEYERYDSKTRTWPDFYFPQLDRYVELHAMCWGPKKLPLNAIMITSNQYIYALVLSLELRIKGMITV